MSYVFAEDDLALISRGKCQTGSFDGITRVSLGRFTLMEGKTDSGPKLSRGRLRMIREDNEILRIIDAFMEQVIG